METDMQGMETTIKPARCPTITQSIVRLTRDEVTEKGKGGKIFSREPPARLLGYIA
jgi:hypothetical protein